MTVVARSTDDGFERSAELGDVEPEVESLDAWTGHEAGDAIGHQVGGQKRADRAAVGVDRWRRHGGSSGSGDGGDRDRLGYGRRRMSPRHHLRRLFATNLVALAIASSVLVGAVAPVAAVAQADTEVFDEDETESTIDRVRTQLLVIAAVTGALLVVYIWHTDPQRRLRVATRRRDARERAAVAALDESFLLPVDVDDPTTDSSADRDGDAGAAGDASNLDADADASNLVADAEVAPETEPQPADDDSAG